MLATMTERSIDRRLYNRIIPDGRNGFDRSIDAEFRQLSTLLAEMAKDHMASDKMHGQIVLEYLDIGAKVEKTLRQISQQITKEMERRERAVRAYIS